MTDIAQEGKLRTRRSLLTAAAGGAAALAVGAIKPGSVAAGVSVPVNRDENNPTTATTSISDSTAGNPAFVANSTGDGTASRGNSPTGMGVFGVSADTTDPANNLENAGVVGVAGDLSNIPPNIALTGVVGISDPSPDSDFSAAGVWGVSADLGVIGSGSVGVLGVGGAGVIGVSGAEQGFGVLAEQDGPDALALGVLGRAVFTRSGKATVKAGTKSKTVNEDFCTSQTIVIAVLASNRAGRYVRAVVPSAGSFKIYLNQDVGSDTKVSWIAFTDPNTGLG